MRKRVLLRALQISVDNWARAGFCVSDKGTYCKGTTREHCARCILKFILRKAKEELAMEGKA